LYPVVLLPTLQKSRATTMGPTTSVPLISSSFQTPRLKNIPFHFSNMVLVGAGRHLRFSSYGSSCCLSSSSESMCSQPSASTGDAVGRVKTDWSHTPFVASYRRYNITNSPQFSFLLHPSLDARRGRPTTEVLL
jgi:hypothetical protein